MGQCLNCGANIDFGAAARARCSFCETVNDAPPKEIQGAKCDGCWRQEQTALIERAQREQRKAGAAALLSALGEALETAANRS